jgi:hypothetical protein
MCTPIAAPPRSAVFPPAEPWQSAGLSGFRVQHGRCSQRSGASGTGLASPTAERKDRTSNANSVLAEALTPRYVLTDNDETLSQCYNDDLAPPVQAEELIAAGHVHGKNWIQTVGMPGPDLYLHICGDLDAAVLPSGVRAATKRGPIYGGLVRVAVRLDWAPIRSPTSAESRGERLGYKTFSCGNKIRKLVVLRRGCWTACFLGLGNCSRRNVRPGSSAWALCRIAGSGERRRVRARHASG